MKSQPGIIEHAGIALFLDDPTAGQPWRYSLELDVSAVFRSPQRVSHSHLTTIHSFTYSRNDFVIC